MSAYLEDRRKRGLLGTANISRHYARSLFPLSDDHPIISSKSKAILKISSGIRISRESSIKIYIISIRQAIKLVSQLMELL